MSRVYTSGLVCPTTPSGCQVAKCNAPITICACVYVCKVCYVCA